MKVVIEYVGQKGEVQSEKIQLSSNLWGTKEGHQMIRNIGEEGTPVP